MTRVIVLDGTSFSAASLVAMITPAQTDVTDALVKRASITISADPDTRWQVHILPRPRKVAQWKQERKGRR